MTSAECRSAFDKGRRLAEWEALKGSLWAGVRLMNPSTCIFAAMQLYIHASVRLEESLKSLPRQGPYRGRGLRGPKGIASASDEPGCLYITHLFWRIRSGFSDRFHCGNGLRRPLHPSRWTGGFAAAYLSELIQPGSAQYVTAIQSAPSSWTEENGEAFGLPAVFTSRSHSPSLSAQRLALFHLHSSLPFSQMP